MMVRDLADLAACELNAEHLALFDGAMNERKQMCTQRNRRSLRGMVLATSRKTQDKELPLGAYPP